MGILLFGLAVSKDKLCMNNVTTEVSENLIGFRGFCLLPYGFWVNKDMLFRQICQCGPWPRAKAKD